MQFSEIKEQTEIFWAKNTRGKDYLRYYNSYIEELLKNELAYIEPLAEDSQLLGGTLAFLVGYSLEPLILAIILLKPKRVHLVLNKLYGNEDGVDRYNNIMEIIKLIKDLHQVKIDDFQETIESDGTSEVFAYLQKYCSNTKDLIIDVTGSKKSMVSGAFF